MVANPLAPPWLDEPADANALASGVWPASARRDHRGALEIGGMPADDLADRYGTPLYVYDERDLRDRAERVRIAFETAAASIGTTATVYYGGKAFLCTAVVRWMAEAGLHLDVCTAGELAVALAAGFDPARLGYHGNDKSLAEIDRAVEVGVGTIVIDSLQEIDRVSEAAERRARRQRVRLRVASGVHASTHEFLATSHEDQKFGLPLSSAMDAVRRIRAAPGLRFVGLHCHIGSQIFGSDGFARSAERVLETQRELLAEGEAPELNLGGGFGIAYTAADRPEQVGRLADRIAEVVGATCDRLGIPVPRLAFEPGRVIVGPPGVTLYRVGTTKDVTVGTEQGTAVRRYVSVDGGMSDNARTALYGADYTVRLAGRRSDAAPALSRLAGKHCESGDIVVQADYLPGDVAPGDLVAVAATGAYCASLASNYNHLPRPAVVAVADGAARVLIRRETPDDLLARDTGVADPVNGASS